MPLYKQIKDVFTADHTIQRVRRDGTRILHALPSASVHYVVDKLPVVFWLPQYNPRWMLNDLLAGITIGVLLIPQSLAYAKICTIPGQYGLMSSWLPNFLYFFMGTSKDLSTGPTSLMGLLTAEIIRDVSKDYPSPQAVSSAVSLSVGVYCLVVGLFRLGFLLEFVSIPVLHGFISAAGLVIMLGQIPSLFGVDARTGTAHIIHDVFAGIPHFQGPTVGVGLGAIVLLIALQKMGQRWGKTNKIIWFIALARSAIILILFTGISYAVNRHINLKKDDPVWALSKVTSNGIRSSGMPEGSLIRRVFARSAAPFLACTLEHLAIAKGFARKNNYVIDPAQELVYLGVTNFFNSFFSSMPVGGAMSRTAVNSETGVRSPAYGFVAGGVVILSIFKLSPALYWIPKATLAAIIVTAVWTILSPPKVFYGYWKTSLVDFVASMLAFWVTLFVSTEAGIGAAVGFNILYYIICTAFAQTKRIGSVGQDRHRSSSSERLKSVAADTQVFKFSQPIIFPNAFYSKGQCFDVVQTYNSGAVVALEVQRANRNWSVSGQRRIKRLRARAEVAEDPVAIKLVVLDMSMVTTIDTTGLVALHDLNIDLGKFGGDEVELRFVGIKKGVWAKFERYGWKLVDANDERIEKGGLGKGSRVYESVTDAVVAHRMTSSATEPVEVLAVGDEKV